MLRPSSRLSYADAVHLLGAGESTFLAFLGRLAGAPAAVAATATLSSVDLLAVRNEIVEWGQSVTRSLRERRAGLSRFDRTERLTAAHAVLVVSSFFEALGDAAREVTLAEQVAIAARSWSESDRSGVISLLAGAALPMPSAAAPTEALHQDLRAYYVTLAGHTSSFLAGLIAAAPDPPAPPEVADLALRRYLIGYRSLAAEVPEFAIWAAMTEAAAGRAETRRVGDDLATGLAEIRSMLGGLTGAARTCRTDLADQYRKELSRPIVDVGDLPDDLRLPPTADLYINPRARVRRAEPAAVIAAESWWDEAVAVTDIQSLLAGHLTSPDATRAPLIVLGQPGSGKSLLTRVLAAVLPPEEFLAVRVELRTVAADAPIQDQIESAVHDTIGERPGWPELVRSAGDALPVVLLDGLDELLQASGADRADYLEQVRDFQRREADRNRPVAVLVTSRVVVADRVRVPHGSVVLRLDPFDDEQIGAWLGVWRATNTAGLAARSLRPLTAEVALRFRELAEQPLLLLMLAVHDSWDNALLDATGHLERTDLYERLFTDFARRELSRREPAAPIDEPAVARELRRLEFVAIALFVRGAQVVTEHELDADLRDLLSDDRVDRPGHDRPLSAAQLLVGRFFFLHESRAREGVDQPRRSFEFLHATFGEFLVARLVVTTLIDLAGERAHQARRPRPSPVDAGPLAAWLSSAVLAGRGPIIEFGRRMLGRLPADTRKHCDALLRDLVRVADSPPPTWSLASYQPVPRTAAEREAAFSANLVTLIVMLADGGVDVDSLGLRWRAQALLWESRLPSHAWRSLWAVLRISVDPGDERATLTLEDQPTVSLRHSMPWGLPAPDDAPWGSHRLFRDVVVPSASLDGEWLREAAFRRDSGLTLVLAHSAAPFWRAIGPPYGSIVDASSLGSDLEVLLELVLASRGAGGARHLSMVYLAALHTFRFADPGTEVVLRMLEDDARRIDTRTVLNVLLDAVHQSQAETRRYLTEHADKPARILAVCHSRNGDPELIRAVYDRIGGHLRVRPGEQAFRELLRQEFEIVGVAFPEDLFT
ncbi:NACHT domain-containing NTPase [Actinoplanes sp. M2I2]|uniref:NACHT domain-containing protein n=1 Tax=Actinoplanes sp. M2I2 TaxID=1734444 RepID=UPI002020B684|nr:hypothetical protein [Actinoplanes sp. M2I2]